MMDPQTQLRRRPGIRVFVSSTFADLQHERDALQRDTTSDLIHALAHEQKFAALRQAAHLVVRLDLEGVVHLANLGSAGVAVDLTYLPTGIEGSTREEIPGEMLGFSSVFVAMLAAELAKPGPAPVAAKIRAGLRLGIAATRKLFQEGLGLASTQPDGVASAFQPTAQDGSEFVTVNVAPLAGRNLTSRLVDYVRTVPLEPLAGQIVAQGIRPTIPKAPVAKFGVLETLDRSEIETFRSIRNLINEYLLQTNPERPLCIAVFGPPGSGKSFGVADGPSFPNELVHRAARDYAALRHAISDRWAEFARLEGQGKGEAAVAFVERLVQETGVLRALNRATWAV